MRFQFAIAALLVAAPAFSQTVTAVESPDVRRARNDLARAQDLVNSGVLPRIDLENARNKLADALDEDAIRNGLSKKDITVEEADTLVALTAKRVERRQKAVDNRNNLVAQGIIARSEAADAEHALAFAKTDQQWAESRAKSAREMVALIQNEQEIMRQLASNSGSGGAIAGGGLVEHFVGSNHFDLVQFPAIEKAFFARFSRALPVSAMGETEVHKALGFDHRNRVDIALQPEEPAGLWLRHYLTVHSIPFFAFRTAVPGKATGAHIHIGPPSERYVVSEHPSSQNRTL